MEKWLYTSPAIWVTGLGWIHEHKKQQNANIKLVNIVHSDNCWFTLSFAGHCPHNCVIYDVPGKVSSKCIEGPSIHSEVSYIDLSSGFSWENIAPEWQVIQLFVVK